MNPEGERARQQRADRCDTQDADKPMSNTHLPRGCLAREPSVANQHADDNCKAEVLQGDEGKPRDAKETVVHHFT
jgi:hypothetical protein